MRLSTISRPIAQRDMLFRTGSRFKPTTMHLWYSREYEGIWIHFPSGLTRPRLQVPRGFRHGTGVLFSTHTNNGSFKVPYMMKVKRPLQR